MRLHVVACQVFSRELCSIAAQSSHVVELDLLPQGLHDTPALLREMVGEAIQKVEDRYQKGISKYLPDAIILGYGLCSNGVVGLQAGKIPLVVPRTDDCIGIFLGSQRRYLDLFQQYPGIYWFNHGWIENAFIPTKEHLKKKISAISRTIWGGQRGVSTARGPALDQQLSVLRLYPFQWPLGKRGIQEAGPSNGGGSWLEISRCGRGFQHAGTPVARGVETGGMSDMPSRLSGGSLL
jgi:hypothetical protein